MKIGSLFSGIGGLELGLEQAGLGETAWQVEIDPFCRSVLAQHWPEAERFEDVKRVGAHNLARVDVLCGGFPCQDVSSAGKGAGIKEGTRSGLWFEYRRIVRELAPPWVVVENVASGAKRWLPQVRRDLHLLGYDTAAVALSAADVGAPHLRKRIFVIAHPYPVREPSLAQHAEVGGTSESFADAHDGRPEGQRGESLPVRSSSDSLVVVREQQGGLGGPHGAGASVTANDGVARPFADPHAPRRERPGTRAHEGWVRSPEGAWGTPLGGVVPVVHGLPGGVVGRQRRERIRALGNSVVPQCAEVIGRWIAAIQGSRYVQYTRVGAT
jgi:DNA (cytosine-5)-methyltransferase 1